MPKLTVHPYDRLDKRIKLTIGEVDLYVDNDDIGHEEVEQFLHELKSVVRSWPDYVTGTGQPMVNVHRETEDCHRHGCVIHAPSNHSMRGFPTHWRDDRGIMERLCPEHGVGHPDPDDMNYIARTFGEAEAQTQSVHGCCGCCAGAYVEAEGPGLEPETP